MAELSKEDSAKASELYKRLKAAEQEYAGFKIQSNRSRAPLWLRRCRVSALRVCNAQADMSAQLNLPARRCFRSVQRGRARLGA